MLSRARTLLSLQGRNVPELSAEKFRGYVEELNTAFVTWRYLYETGTTGLITSQSTVLVMAALDGAARQLGAMNATSPPQA